MKNVNVVQSPPVSAFAPISIGALISALMVGALVFVAIYALAIQPETDPSYILFSLAPP